MYRLEQGRPGQMPEIIKFAKRAFSTEQRPVDFPRLLPKLYGPDKTTEDCHTLLYNDDVLEGMYALRVLSVRAASLPLRVGWIGTVAVRPEARGKGHLQRLMEHANLRLEQLDCDLGVLGGQRQRYQRFGYEYAGTQWKFDLDGRNLRQVGAGEYRLQRLMPDSPWLHRISYHHIKNPIHCQRSEAELYDILCSWQAVPWVILKGEEYAGYCTAEMAGKNAILREFCILDGNATLVVCRAALRDLACENMQIVLPPWPGREQKALAAVSGRVRLTENHNYRIVHWLPVLRAAAAVRQMVGPPMTDGTLQFALQKGPALELRVKKRSVKLQEKEQRPSWEWQQQQAMRLLLGPDSTLADPGCTIPPGWLPLPLSFSWQDGI